MNLIEMTRVAGLYDLNDNAVLVQYGTEQLPNGQTVIRGKVYRCGSGAKVEELMKTLEADGKSAVGFNAEAREISQCNV